MKKLLAAMVAILAIFAVAVVPSAAQAKSNKTFKVCPHGCKYKTLTSALKKVKKKNSTIKIKPGKYAEGVIVQGHKYDGLTIEGTSKDASKVVFNGKNAKIGQSLAQQAIEGVDVDNLTLKNMTAKNFATNGFYVRASDPANQPKIECNDYVMKNLVAAYDRSYGLFAFGCAGGKIIDSVGYGMGDSAIYIGGTPYQADPDWSVVSGNDAYMNVLGYSGTNSKYVNIKDNNFYNNGAGVVPNTLDSEPFEPAEAGKIHDNAIFWNNFNYYMPDSPVETVSDGLGQVGGVTLNYPTGIGVIVFGGDGWKIYDNQIFGNFKWGSASFSDPFNDGHDAVNQNNEFTDNMNGRDGTDPNGIDFWNDGSGSGNCFSGNTSSTNSGATNGGVNPGHTEAFLYPSCPAPGDTGTGSDAGDPFQVAALVKYSGSTPPQNMACDWDVEVHPAYEDFQPIDATQSYPVCPMG